MTPALQRRHEMAAGILDQGLSAGAGFLASVAIARWLSREEYGAYGVALSVAAWLLTVHTALVSEPLLIFGPSRFSATMQSYVRRLLELHVLLCLGVGSAVALAFALFARGVWSAARPAIVATGLLLVCSALPMLGRRLLYAVRRVEAAAAASAVQLGAATVLLATLQLTGSLNAVSAVGALALAALLAGLASLGLQRRFAEPEPPEAAAPSLRSIWVLHTGFGRWGLLSAGLAWANTNVPVLFLPGGGSLAAVATLRAATNLMAPMLQLNAAVGVVRLPGFVRMRGTDQFARVARSTLLAMAALSLLFWGILAVAGGRIASLLYQSRYADLGPLLLVVGLLPLTEGLNFVMGSALRSLERPDLAVRAQGLAFLLITLPGGVLALTRGPLWAAATMLLASALSAASLAVVLYGSISRIPTSPPAERQR